jgi:nucleoid DNA-binding protein
MNKIAKYIESPLLKKACIKESDVLIIWDALAYYIRDEMSRKRGIVLPGFGTFTFVERRLDINCIDKQLLKLKPFFILSDKFAKNHMVDFEKDYVNLAIPVSRLNYAAVSEVTNRKYSREIVELVLNEAFTAIDYFLRVEGLVNIPFNGLGILRIHDKNPKPKKQTYFEFSSAFQQYMPIH